MPVYLHPGVYVEEIPSGSKPIEGVGTSTAAFVGYTTKGPIGEPELILKWDDYVNQYGGIRDTEGPVGDHMGFSVSAFFQNGGGKAYIVRITKNWKDLAGDPADRGGKAIGAMDHPSADNNTDALLFTAANEGRWANGLVVEISSKPVPVGDDPLYTVSIGRKNDEDPPEFFVDETFTNISLITGNPKFITNVINGVSELVTVEIKPLNEVVEGTPSLKLGMSISGDLTGLSLNLSSVAAEDRTLIIALDGTTPIERTLSDTPYATLADIAQAIQDEVRSGSGHTTERQKYFTCEAEGSKLVLTSGTHTDSSAVVVQDSSLAKTLKLGVIYKGTSTSGDLSTRFAGLNLLSETDAANRSLSGSIDGAAFTDLDFGQEIFTTLDAVKDKISEIPGLTCTVVGGTLVLTSDDTTIPTSAVVIANSGVASTLKLGTDNGGTEQDGAAYEAPNGDGIYIGTSTSGDLSTTFGLDLLTESDVANRSLSGSIDGAAFPDLDFGQEIFATLEDVKDKISEIPGLTCTVVGGTLVLTSDDTTIPTSAVVITNSGVASTLKLGTANGGTEQDGAAYQAANGGEETTGSESSIDSYDIIVGPGETTLGGGEDGNGPLKADYTAVFTKFLKIRDINIICLPGQNWPKDLGVDVEGQPVIDAAIGHAVKMKSRMVIVDPPSGLELDTELKVNDLRLPNKTYSVLYYPWAKVANPFYNAEDNPGAEKTVLVPPCGFAAGMWARIDGKRGVWKAPAGLETGLGGLAGLEFKVEDGEQDSLNPLGVNCLRSMPGPVIWGARTLATKADPEWRYVPVRRTAIMIEQSIYNGIQWAVFEPNDHRLWAALRGNIGGFMNSLFRVGAFQGEKASDAYFVRCGLGDTMTQTDIDAGQVIVIVGFAPLKPAEFVIVRIQQKVNQQ